jgi:hypothetical protein
VGRKGAGAIGGLRLAAHHRMRCAVCTADNNVCTTAADVPVGAVLSSHAVEPGSATAARAVRRGQAIELLEPMTTDPVDYVRQGALIALAMVLVQVKS